MSHATQEKSCHKKSATKTNKTPQKKLETHEPDYFYRRGIKFNE